MDIWSEALYFYCFWSKDYDNPIQDVFGGGTEDLKFESFNINTAGDRILIYSRLLNTGDNYDNVITVGSNKLVSAWSLYDNNIGKHGAYVGVGSFTVDIANLKVTASIGKYTLWELHGIGLLIVWSILNALSYTVIRLLKHNSFFLWAHRLSGFVITLITIAFTVISITTNAEGPKNDKADITIHTIIGFIIAGSSIIMLITGVAQGVLVYGKSLTNDKLFYLKLGHKIIGHVLTYACIVSSITGGWVLYQS